MKARTLRYTFTLALAASLGAQVAPAAETRFDLEHGLRVRSDDRRWQLDIDARVHYDAARFNSDVTPLADDQALRRARLGFGLEFADRVAARVDYEFGKVSPGWKNLWLQYAFTENVTLRAGNQTVPFGLDESASSDSLMFMERALPNALAPRILQGALLRIQGKHWSASTGLFGNDISDEDTRKMKGHSAIARVAYAPVNEDRSTFHVGASFEYRDASPGASVRYRTRPEVAVTSVRLIDTGTIAGVANLETMEADLAWAPGPFTLQFEALRSIVSRDLAGDLGFQGVSGAVSFVLTGERRPYRVGTGSFGSIRPRHKWGAIEIAGRYSHLDLTDGSIAGGTEDNVGVALNWYWTRGSRLALDYIKVRARPNRLGVDESPDILSLRLQLGF